MMLQKILLLCLVLIVIFFGGWLYVQKTNPENMTEGTLPGENTNTADEEMSTNSLRELMGGGDLKCTFRDEVSLGENGTVQGTIFLSEGNVSGVFVTDINDQTFETHVLHDGESTYIWGDSPYGTQAFKLADDGSVPEEGDENPGIELDKQLPYECSVWEADASQFIPPEEIEFQDIDTGEVSV